MAFLKETRGAAEAEEAPPEESAPQEESASGESDWPSGLPEDQQDKLESALKLLHTILYQNPETSKAVLDQLTPSDEPGVQAESIGRAALLLIQQINERIPLDPPVAMYLAPATVSRLVELADRVKKMKLSEEDLSVAFNGVAQGIQSVFQGGGQPPEQAQPVAPEAQPAEEEVAA